MELIFNIWFVVDIWTNLSKYAIVKAYAMNGTDQQKSELLKGLAETDYYTSERIDYATNSSVVFENLTAEGYVDASDINEFFNYNIDFFISKMEARLPVLMEFKGDFIEDFKAKKQKFLLNPLFVLTILMENDWGEIRPYTTKENRDWYENEKARLEIKSKGMQN